MVAWVPLARTALKVAPIALEVGRQLDRQLRPHVLAYRLAREIDGYVARWTGGDAPSWVVFPSRDAAPLRAFPPLAPDDLQAAASLLDPAARRHWSTLPEARLAGSASTVARAPRRAADRLRRARG